MNFVLCIQPTLDFVYLVYVTNAADLTVCKVYKEGQVVDSKSVCVCEIRRKSIASECSWYLCH